MALDTGFPAGMTVYLSVCITKRALLGYPQMEVLASRQKTSQPRH